MMMKHPCMVDRGRQDFVLMALLALLSTTITTGVVAFLVGEGRPLSLWTTTSGTSVGRGFFGSTFYSRGVAATTTTTTATNNSSEDATTILPKSTPASSSAAAAATSLLDVLVVEDMPDPLSCELRHRYYLLRHGESTANVDGIISSSPTLAYTDVHGLTMPRGYEQAQQCAIQVWDCLRTSNELEPNDYIVFVSSPFARAYQTAQICLATLLDNTSSSATVSPEYRRAASEIQEWNITLSSHIIVKDQLRERYFGRLDGQGLESYAYVWPLDRFNVTHTTFGVESVAAVCYRIQDLVYELEQEAELVIANHLVQPMDGDNTAHKVQEDNDGSRDGSSSSGNNHKGKCHFILVSHADVLQIAQLYAAQADNVGEFSSYRFANGEVRAMLIGSDSCLPDPMPLQPPRRGTQQQQQLATPPPPPPPQSPASST